MRVAQGREIEGAVGVSKQIAPPRSHLDLFLGFLAIGARSFGGVMPWAYRAMVEERRWLSAEDFTETVGLCQFLPGPNTGNVSVVLGKRWFGLSGAAVGVLGLDALPLVWMLALTALYVDFALDPVVRAVVTGVGVAGAGLFMATAVKLARPLVRKPAALPLIVDSLLAVGVARLSLLFVKPVALAIAYAAARRAWL